MDLRESYLAAGLRFSLETNDQSILDITAKSFEKYPLETRPELNVHMRFWVDPAGDSSPPWPKSYYRGLDHLIFAGFDFKNSLLIDLRNRSVIGRFTASMAADGTFWKKVIFPLLLTTFSASTGSTVLHCAGVVHRGSGLMLAGTSGSGKSTLSLALAQAGFDFLSDDRALFTLQEGRLLAWGLSGCVKLRQEGSLHFRELSGLAPNDVWNGERVYYLDPVTQLHVSRARCCEPRWIILLERTQEGDFNLEEIDPRELADRLEDGLPEEQPEAKKRQREIIRTLMERECWRLRYGGDPNLIARAIQDFITRRLVNRKSHNRVNVESATGSESPRRDPLRRFTATPRVANLQIMGRTVRLETNSSLVLDHALCVFRRYKENSAGIPHFRWRIVSEADSLFGPIWPEFNAFSDANLRFVNLGQRGFVAIDLKSREAIGFLPESLALDALGFASIFLAIFFYLTAMSMNLVPITAACVALADNGLLLFGPPNSGKTTSSYLARRQGLEFHADHATFLEVASGRLRAWGDFWPAAFRPEAAQYLPELHTLTRKLSHRDTHFLCLDKDPSDSAQARSVIPAVCLFLERGAAQAPKLVPIPSSELKIRLEHAIPFIEDSGSESTRHAVFAALRELPAYRLLYGKEPSVATRFYHSVLNTHHLVEELD
jgi:energy-coupling factor transporter ATP-binding protein EcfA2